MLKEAFENVLPYITNISKVREFVSQNEARDMEEVKRKLEELVETSEGTLKTDYRILLNELEKIINKSV